MKTTFSGSVRNQLTVYLDETEQKIIKKLIEDREFKSEQKAIYWCIRQQGTGEHDVNEFCPEGSP